MKAMFGEIHKRLTGLIFKPGETWAQLHLKEEKQNTFLSRFIYPLIGLITLSAFLGVLFTRKEFDFEIAIKITIRTFVAITGGFFLGAYLLNELWKSVFKQPKNTELCRTFVGYSSSLMFVLNIVTALLPEFFFLNIVGLYTVYMIWEGSIFFMEVKEEVRLKFVVFASFIVIVTPFIIEQMLRMLMPGFRI
jgi:hypothetical protein